MVIPGLPSQEVTSFQDQSLLLHYTERTGGMEPSSARSQMFLGRYRESLSLKGLAPTPGLG